MEPFKIFLANHQPYPLTEPITAHALAKKLSVSLAKKAIAVKINEQILPLSTMLKVADHVEFILKDDKVMTRLVQFTTGLLTAMAIKKLYPQAEVVHLTADFNGFDLDFRVQPTLKATDCSLLEKLMHDLQKSNPQPWVTTTVAPDHASQINSFIAELTTSVLFHYNPVAKILVTSQKLLPVALKYIKFFKIHNLAGAYWKNDANQPMLQRLHGFGTTDQILFEGIKKHYASAAAFDHRMINKKLDLFMFDQAIGPGLPIWLPAGMVIKREIMNYIHAKEQAYGFLHVQTPILADQAVYVKSGHLKHYASDMFPAIQTEHEAFMLRPMACPHHIAIYQRRLFSYRELPYRLAEVAMLHRYEPSGSLTGLERVRVMALTDAHIFVRLDQLKAEFKRCFRLINEVVADFRIKVDYIALALRDPENKEKYYPDDAMWRQAETVLQESLDEIGVEYRREIGEAAFYGPKMDVQIRTALGHEVTMATLQIDFLMPQRFDLSYIDASQQRQRPILIHRGLIGTFERFLAILLEQTRGSLPVWLCPAQVMIIPVSHEHHLTFCREIQAKLRQAGIRVSVDDREERLSYKVRAAQQRAIPFLVTVGDQEVERKQLAVRRRNSHKIKYYTLVGFKKIVLAMVRNKR